MATHSFDHKYRVDKDPNSSTFRKKVYSGSECRNSGCYTKARFTTVAQVIG